jgi:hypothetical protein
MSGKARRLYPIERSRMSGAGAVTTVTDVDLMTIRDARVGDRALLM